MKTGAKEMGRVLLKNSMRYSLLLLPYFPYTQQILIPCFRKNLIARMHFTSTPTRHTFESVHRNLYTANSLAHQHGTASFLHRCITSRAGNPPRYSNAWRSSPALINVWERACILKYLARHQATLEFALSAHICV